jgi:hypothetical protein
MLAVLASLGFAQVFAQDAPAPADAPPATAPSDAAAPDTAAATPEPTAAQPFDLGAAVENFWHYGKIARYDLAVANGQQILDSSADPADILGAFETTAQQRKDNLDQWLLRWQNVPQMQDVTTKLINTLEQGRRGRAENPDYIRQNIERLGGGERAYTIAIGRLRNSGEVAAAFMIDYLRDPAKVQHHAIIRRALRDMGRYALNPLVAATEMKDWDTLMTVCNVLGDLGYDSAAPFLARLATAMEIPVQVKAIATDSLGKLGFRGNQALRPADMFFDLGEKLYYDKSSIAADNRRNVAYIWFWSDKGLVKKDVPPPIFNELMCMRACEYALKLGDAQNDALSLWLAANYKREVELPAGATDPTRLENQPDAHYYGVVTGAQYLNNALGRTLRDGNAPVSLKIIKSLQEIIGQSNMFAGSANRPLITAMQYPDRLVRFEAAFALAGALPQRSFEGQEMVVPLLGEALSQTGQPTLFVVMSSENDLNALLNGLKTADGYNVGGATNPEAAVASAAQLPAVDAFIIAESLGDAQVDRLLSMLRASTRLRGSARIIMTQTNASRYETMKVSDSLLFTTTGMDPATLKPAIDEARTKSGSLPVDADIATQYATRAGDLMRDIAISRGQVYDLAAAKTALLASLSDARPAIVMLGGSVLGLLNDRDAQTGLLQTAQDEKTADDVKISLYRSLATSAKFFGNLLDGTQIDSLQKTVSATPNLEVRSAAAEAHGALNLPADQAKSLILEQSRVNLGNPLAPNGGAAPVQP